MDHQDNVAKSPTSYTNLAYCYHRLFDNLVWAMLRQGRHLAAKTLTISSTVDGNSVSVTVTVSSLSLSNVYARHSRCHLSKVAETARAWCTHEYTNPRQFQQVLDLGG